MSTQKDVISERRRPSRGSSVRIRKIEKKALAKSLGNCVQFPVRSANVKLQLGGNHHGTAIAKRNSRHPAAKVRRTKSLFADFLVLVCDGFDDLTRECKDSGSAHEHLERILALTVNRSNTK
jgi:hypothetical protein